MKYMLILIALLFVGCKEAPPPFYVGKGEVVKNLVKEETALSSRKEWALVNIGCTRYKVRTDMCIKGDSVKVYRRGGYYFIR